jgi:hypothetical protein
MEIKVVNLALFPNKRNKSGIGQAELIVRVVNKYLDKCFMPDDPRSALQAAERIVRFAARDPACFAWRAFGIDVLNSIPESFESIPGFGDQRLPQIRGQIAARREKFSDLWVRMSKRGDPMKHRFRV